MSPASRLVLPVAVLFLLVGCQSGGRRSRRPVSDGRTVVIPNAVAGDAQVRGAVAPGEERPAPQLTTEQAQRRATERRRRAEALWNRAVALEQCNPAAAAGLFGSIVDDYPDYEQAAEALFREGRSHFKARRYVDAANALKDYTRLAPVNPHLADVEEMIYESGTRELARRGGLFAIFKSDDDGLDALKFVAEHFRTGDYPDDALLALGKYFCGKREFAASALHYRELLIRYPDSEWSFDARRRLGATYLARDQGTPYHAGFIDIDPRAPVEGPAAIMAGPIISAPKLAYDQYEMYLGRMAADPDRACEYRRDVACVEGQLKECKERLAAKDLSVGDWYARDGKRCAAITYYRSAARFAETRSGQVACRKLRALEARGQAPARGTRPVRQPAPTRVAPGVAPRYPAPVAMPSGASAPAPTGVPPRPLPPSVLPPTNPTPVSVQPGTRAPPPPRTQRTLMTTRSPVPAPQPPAPPPLPAGWR